MKKLSLFSGIGGIDLAAKWADMETVAFCEREPFPQKVLKKHWPDIPIYDDVCTLTKERLENDGIDTGTIRIISAGYPCQPFSVAGERKGENDDRHLWPEVFRLIQAIQPMWFIGENVAGHITLGLDIVLADLESINYEWETFVLPAAAVGAHHQRERVFIVASYISTRLPRSKFSTITGEKGLHSRRSNEKNVSNANGIARLEAYKSISTFGEGWNPRNYVSWSDWGKASRFDRPHPEPAVQRVVDGISRRLDEDRARLKALGNAVVPAQIYPILAAIKAIDDQIKDVSHD